MKTFRYLRETGPRAGCMRNVRIEDAVCICLLGAQENVILPIETNINLLEVCHIIVP